jgi:predicted regulator of Ras-like GTPase activity (Roadblock/LC7/MglB family)
MSFEAILREIVSQCPGCVGAALMGSDGIPIAEVGGDRESDEVTLLGVEFGRVLDEARKGADAAAAGGLLELAVRTERCHVLLHAVDRETYLVLVLAPEGNVGKGRYLLRRSLPAIRQEL